MPARKLLVLGKGVTPHTQAVLRTFGWEQIQAGDVLEAIELSARLQFAIGLLWLADSGSSAVELLYKSPRWQRNIQWVAVVNAEMLAYREIAKLVSQACVDYHTQPVDPTRLANTLGHVWGCTRLREQCNAVEAIADKKYGLIGSSLAMQQLYRKIEKIENTDAPILIRGESGTGKELVARAIHQCSARATKPFIALNCGAISCNLIHSELFGHEKGAFTGAHQRKIGRLEAADGGSIFLDEIGDLPLEQQVSLLRFLQERSIERVGGTQSIPLDVRVISATHVNLEQAIERGKFRLDLYYRINVLQVEVPPLRDRVGDIERLAHAFAEQFSRHGARGCKDFTHQAINALQSHSWPGNVRELMNRVHGAVLLAEERMLTPADLGLEQHSVCNHVITLESARSKAEEEAIRTALRQNQNNVATTARQLGVSRMTLYRLLDKHQCQL